MLLALVGTIRCGAALFVDVITRMNQMQHIPKITVIYGTWVEQKVAHYAKDEFVLNASDGVSVSGSIVATRF